jgi:hypothetical protein
MVTKLRSVEFARVTVAPIDIPAMQFVKMTVPKSKNESAEVALIGSSTIHPILNRRRFAQAVGEPISPSTSIPVTGFRIKE